MNNVLKVNFLQNSNLESLNQFKKQNPEKRKLQNKRYREKYRVMISLKKQLAYHKKKYFAKLSSI